MAIRPFRPSSQTNYAETMRDYLVSRNSRLTNFNPGSRLQTLIEAVSFVLAQGDVNTLNGFQFAIREGVYTTFGFSRNPGLKAIGAIRIEHEGHDSPIPIPLFKLDLFGLEFESIEATQIPVGQNQIEVSVRAMAPGTDYNIRAREIDTSEGLGTLDIALPGGARAWNPFDFVGGTDIETEESRLRRFQGFIQSLGRSTELGIYNAVLAVPGVAGCQIETNVHPLTRQDEIGWINIYVSDGTSDPSQVILDLVRRTVVGDLDDPINFPGYAAAGTSVFIGKVPVLGIVIHYELDILETSRLSVEEAKEIADIALANYINTVPLGFDILLQQLETTILRANNEFYRVRILTAYGRKVNASSPLFGEWLPGNVFSARSNSVPVLTPIPAPVNITVALSDLPRVGGSSGGIIQSTAFKVVPL